MLPLLKVHQDEVAQFKDIKLDPDFSQYQAVQDAGRLRVYTMRVRGELMGYASFLVANSLHCKGSYQALQDTLFLLPRVRRGLAGYRFLKWCDRQLQIESVQVVYHEVTDSRDFGALLKRLGYKKVSTFYARRFY